MLDDENPPEITYHKGDLLAITIQPDDKMQGFNTPKRFQDFINYYNVKFQRLFEDPKLFQYYFRIELSEPIQSVTSPPRLHLHGTLKLIKNMSVFKWLCDILPDLLVHARVEIKHIHTSEKLNGWLFYCEKQLEVMPTNSSLSSITDAKTFELTTHPFVPQSGPRRDI